jgi:putative flippase GtrA
MKSLAEPRRYHHVIYRVARQEWLREFTLHVLTGFLTVLAHYTLMWLLIHLGFAPVPASALGFLAGATTRYTLSYTKVFSPADGVPATLTRFIAALGMQWLANVALLDALLSLGWSLWIAQVTTTVLLTVVNYLVYRLWVFRA